MNRNAIFHALISILWQRQYENSRRLLTNPADIVLDKRVPNGARFTQWLTHDDDDEIFDLLRRHNILADDVADGGYDARVHALRLDHPTLWDHLEHRPLSDDLDEQGLIGCFIEHAVRLDRYSVIGSVRLGGLPIHKDLFGVPRYFDEAVSELARAGYCAYASGTARWLPGMASIMKARGFWIGERTSDEIRAEQLARIWNTTPALLRRLMLEDSGVPNALVLAVLMGEYWDEEEGWVFRDGDLRPGMLDDVQLKGGHLPAAVQIRAMVRNGTLR